MSKVSLAMLVIQGLVGPKPRLKSVGDGHPVNIPEPFVYRYQLWGDWRGDSEVLIGQHSSNKPVLLGKSGRTLTRVVTTSQILREAASSDILSTRKPSM